MSQTSLFIQAAKGKPVERVPIWLMRQAGRSMKVYRDLRQKYSMIEVMTTPELASEVTMQPVKAYGVDAAILFSDILVVPDALGLGLEYHDSKGPLIARPIQTQADVDRLDLDLIPGRLNYVLEAIKLVKQELSDSQTPLIGFAGSPFTIASYIVGEGKGHDLKQFMPIVFANLRMIHHLLDIISKATIRYLNAQIKAGVDAVQIFDSWSNVLAWPYFKELSLPYLKQVIAGLDNPRHIPVIVFGTSYGTFYPLLIDSGADVISIDSHVDIADVRKNVPERIALQGNLDPYFLLAPQSIIKEQATSILESMRGKGFIFNLGHGVLPAVPQENVKFLVDLVKQFRY